MTCNISALGDPPLGCIELRASLVNCLTQRSKLILSCAKSCLSIQKVRASENRVYYNLKGPRPVRVCKTWKGSSKAVRVLNSFGAQETNMETKADGKEKLLIDCGPDQQCVLGGIVALGKFDALHIGHRELAIQAAKMGVPFLLSFVGMAEVLGWEKSEESWSCGYGLGGTHLKGLPVVAKCDRKRALSLWAPLCGGMVPHEYHVEFAKVRSLSPQQFVECLSKELGVRGVVAGANYRFGYKASGDASDLVQLCGKYGLKAYIVDPVMDKLQGLSSGQTCTRTATREKGQVSSTLVRKALAAGDIKRVEELLGRKHRLMLATNNCIVTEKTLLVHSSCVLNQPPRNGEYGCMIVIKFNDDTEGSNCNEKILGHGKLQIDAKQIEVTLHEGSFSEPLNANTFVGLEFAGANKC